MNDNSFFVQIPTLQANRGNVLVSANAHLNPLIQDISILFGILNGNRAAYNGQHYYNPIGDDPDDFKAYQRHRICTDNAQFVIFSKNTSASDITKTVKFYTGSGTHTYTFSMVLHANAGIEKTVFDLGDMEIECNEIYKVQIAGYNEYTLYFYAGEFYPNDTDTTLCAFENGTEVTFDDWNQMFEAMESLRFMTDSPRLGTYTFKHNWTIHNTHYGLQLSSGTLFVHVKGEVGGGCDPDNWWRLKMWLNGEEIEIPDTDALFTEADETRKIHVGIADYIEHQALSIGDIADLRVDMETSCQYELGGITVYAIIQQPSPDSPPLYEQEIMAKYVPGDKILKANGLLNIRNNLQWLIQHKEAWIIAAAPSPYMSDRWSATYDHTRPYLHALANDDINVTITWWDGQEEQTESWSLLKDIWDTFDLSSLSGIYTGTLVYVTFGTDKKIECFFTDNLGYPNKKDQEKSEVVATEIGTIDHGGLTGLWDDDHPQYLLANGARIGATGDIQEFKKGILSDGPTTLNGTVDIGEEPQNYLKYDGSTLFLDGTISGVANLDGTNSDSWTINNERDSGESSLIFGADSGDAKLSWDGSKISLDKELYVVSNLSTDGNFYVDGTTELSDDAVLDGNLNVLGTSTLNSTIIDTTSTEAFLVRKNNDAGDIFIVDTEHSKVKISVDEIADAFTIWNTAAGENLFWIDSDNAISGLNLPFVIDYSDNEAFLVRKTGDSGDVFTINTNQPKISSNSDILFSSPRGASGYIKFSEYDDGDDEIELRVNKGYYNLDSRITINPEDGILVSSGYVSIGEYNGQVNIIGYLNSSLIPLQTDTIDLGRYDKLWRKGWLSELEAILFAKETVSVTGGWWMIPHASGTLGEDVDETQTDINFGKDAGGLNVNDFVLMRGISSSGSPQMEYMQITAIGSGNIRTVTRDLDGTGANAWPKGHVWVNIGYNGTGRIEFNAQTGGPRQSLYRQGTAYNEQVEYLRLGDMDGSYGYTSEIYGVGIGAYSNADYMTADAINGIQFWDSSNIQRAQLTSGAWTLGNTSNENIQITPTGVQIRNGADSYAKLSDDYLYLGNSSYTQIIIDPTHGIRFFDSNDVLQAQLTGTTWTLGDTSSEHIEITNSAVNIKDGSIVYTSLSAGILTLGDNNSGEYISIDTSGGIGLYSGGVERTHLSNDGSGWLAGDGKLNWDTSGNITMTGTITTSNITADGGHVGGWTLDSTTLTGTDAILDSGGKLTLGSGNYAVFLDSQNANYRIWVGQTDPGIADFSVDKWGKLRAANIDVSGKITSYEGIMGGWSLDTSSLISTSGYLVIDSANDRIKYGNVVISVANGIESGGSPGAYLPIHIPTYMYSELYIMDSGGGTIYFHANSSEVKITRALRHTGSSLGFFAVGAVGRASATADIKDALTSYGLLQGTSATPLNLDGGALTCGAASINGDLAMNGHDISGVDDLTLNDYLQAGRAKINGTLEVTGTTTLAAFSASGAATLSSTLSVSGNVTMSGELDVSGGLTGNDIDVTYRVQGSRINARTAFQLNGTDGVSGTFQDKDGNTITVSGGIITSLS